MAENIINQLESLAQSTAKFSCALTVFGISQAAKVFKFWPTDEPTQAASDSFDAATEVLTEQYDRVDTTLFTACNTVQQVGLSTTFAALDPQNWTPKTLLQTGSNLLSLSIGQAVQLIPGGKIGVGGPPEGWGPVNAEDGARLNYGEFGND